MFKENKGFKQKGLFDVDQQLNRNQRQLWENSFEHRLFLDVFKHIKESNFSSLYSKKQSRPNVPVNQLVTALILKHRRDWTYEELFTNLNFNSLARHAIGINSINSPVFAPASLFNFQKKVINHYSKTGEDLFGRVFDSLTKAQIEEYGLDTTIQRGDSFLAGSNIFDYTRVQLLLEVLNRLWRVLENDDKAIYAEAMGNYALVEPGKYIYKLKRSDLPKEQKEIGRIYHELHGKFIDSYSDKAIWRIFDRAYKEHFTIVDEKVELKKITSGTLMSPDDEDATYRDKRRQNSKGFVVHGNETAHPDNEINLITDIVVHPNNVDDAVILGQQLESMVELTPDLNECHNDGTYSSPELDEQMKSLGIVQVTTGTRGRKPATRMVIECEGNEPVNVTCEGGQTAGVELIRTKENGDRHFKSIFNYDKCKTCPLAGNCSAKELGTKRGIPKRVWYFGEKEILKRWRDNNYDALPKERRTLRANVEATMKEMKKGLNNGKLRVRGLEKAKIYATFTAIAVNLGRIHRHIVKKAKNSPKKDDNKANLAQKPLCVFMKHQVEKLAA